MVSSDLKKHPENRAGALFPDQTAEKPIFPVK
jgi:hypothetical protein